MAKRLSVYVGAPLERFLSRRPLRPNLASQARALLGGEAADLGDQISESVAVNRLVERHHAVLADALPALSDSTWGAILNALNGATEHTIDEIKSHSVADAVLDDQGIEWRDDETRDAFLTRAETESGAEIRRLLSMTLAERVAVVDAVERFWGRDHELMWRQVIES